MLAETLSVQGRVAAALHSHTGGAGGVEAVGLNPMFAPVLGFPGRPVLAVVVRDGPAARELLGLVGGWGGRVRIVSAEEHDQLAGATQALTHAAVLAFGLGLAELGADVPALAGIAPPPHVALLALLARIASGSPDVYWDVQAANPHAERARAALSGGLRRVAALVDGTDEAGFTAALAELRTLFGPSLPRHRDDCTRIFEALNGGGPHGRGDPAEGDTAEIDTAGGTTGQLGRVAHHQNV